MVLGCQLGASKKPLELSIDQNLVQTFFMECLGGINDTYFLTSSAGLTVGRNIKYVKNGGERTFAALSIKVCFVQTVTLRSTQTAFFIP